MAGVRVILQIELDSADAADAAVPFLLEKFRSAKLEEGALQYELFRGVEDPAKLVLLEHWATKKLYDKHWADQFEREGSPDTSTVKMVETEYYVHANYEVIDGVWQPVDPDDRMSTVRWA